MMAAASLHHYLALLLLLSTTWGFSITQRAIRPVVVVGKIIIDEYGAPSQDAPSCASVGGGGPQAAFGAAAALALLSGDENDPPLSQPVTLIGPVGGDDWSEREESELRDSLGDAVESICLLSRDSLRTPRIQIWHDENQNVQWRPLNDSFGPLGAESLWRAPRASEFLDAVPIPRSENVVCHVIVEGGMTSPGDGEDSSFLLDPNVQKCIEFLGIEPVVFCSDETGRLKATDVASCTNRLDRIDSLDVVSPDIHLFQENGLVLRPGMEMAVRDGPSGSFVVTGGEGELRVPAATLMTQDGKPVNPTGAGNAYAAAFTACRGCGASVVEAACVATAIGAVLCEYEHMPPWSASVLCRIRDGASEVYNKVAKEVASYAATYGGRRTISLLAR